MLHGFWRSQCMAVKDIPRWMLKLMGVKDNGSEGHKMHGSEGHTQVDVKIDGRGKESSWTLT